MYENENCSVYKYISYKLVIIVAGQQVSILYYRELNTGGTAVQIGPKMGHYMIFSNIL